MGRASQLSRRRIVPFAIAGLALIQWSGDARSYAQGASEAPPCPPAVSVRAQGIWAPQPRPVAVEVSAPSFVNGLPEDQPLADAQEASASSLLVFLIAGGTILTAVRALTRPRQQPAG